MAPAVGIGGGRGVLREPLGTHRGQTLGDRDPDLAGRIGERRAGQFAGGVDRHQGAYGLDAHGDVGVRERAREQGGVPEAQGAQDVQGRGAHHRVRLGQGGGETVAQVRLGRQRLDQLTQ